MMSDFAACYGGFPAASTPWRLFLAAVQRASRYDARRELTTLDAVGLAVTGALTPRGQTLAASARRQLLARAYPLKERPLVFHDNMFRADGVRPSDA